LTRQHGCSSQYKTHKHNFADLLRFEPIKLFIELDKIPDSHVTILDTAFGGLSLNEEVFSTHVITEAASEAGSGVSIDDTPRFPTLK